MNRIIEYRYAQQFMRLPALSIKRAMANDKLSTTDNIMVYGIKMPDNRKRAHVCLCVFSRTERNHIHTWKMTI